MACLALLKLRLRLLLGFPRGDMQTTATICRSDLRMANMTIYTIALVIKPDQTRKPSADADKNIREVQNSHVTGTRGLRRTITSLKYDKSRYRKENVLKSTLVFRNLNM